MLFSDAYHTRLMLAIAMWCLTAPLCADVPYYVDFTGELNRETLTVLRAQSQLVALEECLPASLTSLKRRALADLPNLIQALHSQGFYNADIDLDVDEESSPVTVLVHVVTGPVFRLASFEILPRTALVEPVGPDIDRDKGKLFLEHDFLGDDKPFSWEVEDEKIDWVEPEKQEEENEPNEDEQCLDISLEKLGVEVGGPALPAKILEAEDLLLQCLNNQGYPLAQVAKRIVFADQAAYTVSVKLYVDTGPLAYLDEPSISGFRRVRECYIAQKVTWDRGDIYTPEKIACTFDALERSGLFRCINIELANEVDECGMLPVDINVTECKQRSIGAGVNYSTEWGAGVVGEWQHRNMRGLGEVLTFKTELLRKFQTGMITYRIPDLCCPGLDWLNSVEGEREITDSFHETSWTVSSRVYKRLTPCLQAWAGLALKYTFATHSDNNRHFTLLKGPMQVRYSTADNLLDPSRGFSLNLRFTPTSRLFYPPLNYYTTRFDGAVYVPIQPDDCWILAGRLSLGTILGASRIDIPPAERFYAGSPNLLRGYRYLTVCPLDDEHRPEGGRSLMVISMEARRRVNEDWGIVGFFDLGNVYSTTGPQFRTKQLRSVGVGARYYTPVGPLRLDIAFPLDRRIPIDSAVQIYFSIGQTY
ncbi:MAG: BamA/TamA family outer membrane protein [Chlamydiales bacterium]|nr:BamA/TamA family outer membrane protein [Chlamydiales bacterium]